MSADPLVIAKEARAQAARLRFQSTLGVLKDRVNPPNVAHRAVESVKVKAIALAEDGAETVRQNPRKVAGVAAGIVLLLARKPLLRLFRRRLSKPPRKPESD